MSRPLKILIVAGEASGDLHGARLLQALRRREPQLEAFGIGGDGMRAAGMRLLRHVRDMAFMGFAEVVTHLGEIRRTFQTIMEAAKGERPDLTVLIDYPGFNLRLGKKLKALGIPIFYYIAPQVWAWHTGRAEKMAAFVDRMAVIFPFEVEFFARYGIDARFVGHPLLDGFELRTEREEFFSRLGLSNGPLLALFPGSRRQEVQRLMPPLAALVDRLVERHPDLQVVVSLVDTISA